MAHPADDCPRARPGSGAGLRANADCCKYGNRRQRRARRGAQGGSPRSGRIPSAWLWCLPLCCGGVGAMLALTRRAEGGPIFGAGSETSDSIPAWLSHNEFVQPAAAHHYYGTDVMEAMRTRSIPREAIRASMEHRTFAYGGPILPTRSFAEGGIAVRMADGGDCAKCQRRWRDRVARLRSRRNRPANGYHRNAKAPDRSSRPKRASHCPEHQTHREVIVRNDPEPHHLSIPCQLVFADHAEVHLRDERQARVDPRQYRARQCARFRSALDQVQHPALR